MEGLERICDRRLAHARRAQARCRPLGRGAPAGTIPAGIILAALVASLALLTVTPSALASGMRARASRTLSLRETAQLHMTNRHPPSLNEALNEQGSASGTIGGTIYIHLHIHSNSVSAEVNIYPSGGSLSGSGSARYHVVGGVADFTGTLNVTRGSGKYARARAAGLTFTGAIARRNDAVTVQLSGPLSY